MKPEKLIRYLLLLIAASLSALKPALAQTATGQISGMVADSATHKIPDYITVNIKTDNTPVKALITKADGSFTFTGLKPLKYTVSLSAIGYQTKNIIVDITANTKNNLGTILVQSQTKQLKEVAITADKPIIKQEVDRISYDLQADPDSKVSNVLEMLRKVPFVSLDPDDNILLKGNSSYKIFINGKPSSMMERDPKNILRSMPASTIQRIEVITTPPAKYDAEGLAGIINIITNKKIDNGYNGSVNVNEKFPGGGPGAGTSFTFKEGKFGISEYSGANIYNSPATTSLNTRVTTGATPTNLTQQGDGTSDSKHGYFGTELSYEIDSLNLISGQFNINGSTYNGNSSQSSILNGSASVLQGYDLANLNNGHGRGIDASVNYQLGFKKNKTKLLTFSYRYINYHENNSNDLAATDRINYTTPDYNQDNRIGASEQTVQVDFVQPLKKWNIEAGIKGIFRDNRSDFQYNSFNPVNNQFEFNDTLSNKYNSIQDIFAAYNTWQYAGKSWGIKAGVRIEQTITDADFISTISTVHQNYLNVIPSVALNWNFKNNSSINFGFTQRINRPGINQLNPFVNRSNPNFVSSGNPDLHPVLINDIQFGYHITKKGSLNIGLMYDFAKGLFLQASTFDPATNITYTMYQNTGKASGAGGFVNLNYPITKKWNFNLNSNMLYFWLNGYVDGVLQNNNFLAISLSSSTGYNFEKGWRIGANFDLTGQNPTGVQGKRNGFTSVAVNVNKQLIKDKLSLSASLRNPFTKYRYSKTETHGTDFNQTMINQNYFRAVNFSLNYNFGKLKEGIKKTKRSINNDDK
jgi:ferric enterobactin receptor